MKTEMTNAAIQETEEAFSVPVYVKWPVALVRGAGMKVWDADGREYLDFYGGHCVTVIGHSHPHWVAALTAQMNKLGFYSNVASNDVRAAFVERLARFGPAHLKRSFLCNSGAEANETAVKLAMKATAGRTGVIAMKGGFHGRTAGALSLTHLGGYRNQFPAVVRHTEATAFGDLAALDALLDRDTAAVIVEPVQSMNGVRTAEPGYFRDLVEVCHNNGTLVIFDEIQTGLGRLGGPFAADLFDAGVDFITLAKGLGGGFPVAAVLTTDAVASTVAVGEQGTTFGGGPLACAAGMAVLDVIEREGLIENAVRMERFARENLTVGPVTGLRGHGLLLGLVTEVPARQVTGYLFNQGFLTGGCADPDVVRLMPPLTVKKNDFERLADALSRFSAAQ